jgi:hypothetical protein
MSLQCNIDAKGKAIRLAYGIVLAVAGVVLIFTWAMPRGEWVAWTISSLMLLGGAFAIFEARAGWCVVRAMGFKTRF